MADWLTALDPGFEKWRTTTGTSREHLNEFRGMSESCGQGRKRRIFLMRPQNYEFSHICI
jgi:hypothetical protein